MPFITSQYIERHHAIATPKYCYMSRPTYYQSTWHHFWQSKPNHHQSPNNNNAFTLDPKAFLIGSLHTGLFTLLLRPGRFAHPLIDADVDLNPYPGLNIHRLDGRSYLKYVFHQSRLDFKRDEGEVPLPKGYRYCDRRGRHGVLTSPLDIVQSRTHIPRSKEQMSSIPSVAIYHDCGEEEETTVCSQSTSIAREQNEIPIAWPSLGSEGALATLRVEPDHGGKGLATCLSMECVGECIWMGDLGFNLFLIRWFIFLFYFIRYCFNIC